MHETNEFLRNLALVLGVAALTTIVCQRLRYRADLSFEEIGAALGIRPVSARSHVSRALDRLAVLIREEEETR